MLKFRITYYNKDELKKAIKALGKNFIILGTSKSYSCRNSNAKNIIFLLFYAMRFSDFTIIGEMNFSSICLKSEKSIKRKEN